MATPRTRTGSRSGHARRALIIGVTAAVTVGLAACGDSEPAAETSAPAAAGNGGAPADGCGSVPEVAAKDGQGLLAKLPADVAAAYNGYQSELTASPWANWKPSHPAPYKVAIVWNPPISPFPTNVLKAMTTELTASGDVTVTSETAPQSVTDVPGNIQLFNQAAATKPDLIITMPLAAGPLIPAVEAAAKAGIPTVSAWVATPTPSAVSVGTNNWLQAATLSSKVAADLKGSGNVLLVHGIPGIQQDVDAFAGFKAVLATCPDLKAAGEVTGGYSTAGAKAAVLQYLSSHPGKIDAVFQAGTMTAGIVQAFQQLGRPVPAIADLGSSRGSLAFAQQNADSFRAYGTSTPDDAIGQSVAKVVRTMLRDGGPVLNQLVTESKIIDNGNLDSVVQDGWTVSDSGDAALPGDSFFSDEQLRALFGGK